MERPTLENVLNDRARKVQYVFLAFRAMTRDEKVQAYTIWQAANKTPASGSVVIIETSIGIND